MFSRRRGKIHPYRIFFWTAVVLGTVLAILQRYPITLEANDPTLDGQAVSFDGRGDVMIVLDSEAIEQANAAGRLDRSYVWVDLIRQEIGPVRTLESELFSLSAIEDVRTLVITTSAATGAMEQRVGELEAFVRGGGTLALELPTGALRTAFAADGAGGWRRPNEITAADGIDGPLRDELFAVPLLARFLGSTTPLEGSQTLLAFDGSPVVYARVMGEGEVIIFDFEVAIQISRLQQGVPDESGRVTARRLGDPLRTSDLAATPALLDATIPYADLLERYIAHGVLGHHAPMFALWPYPKGGRGALISTHESRHLNGRPLWMSIHERGVDARTTTFVEPPPEVIPGETLIDDPEFAGHAALLWVLDPREANLYRRYGAFGLAPLRQSLTLVDQLEQLQDALGERADIRGVRIRDGRWTRDIVEPFRAMEAAELSYSTSYGSHPDGPQGILFGTCQPFTPADLNGLPFSLQEVPVCFKDPTGEEDAARFAEALDSASTYGFALHLLTSSDRFRARPDLPTFDVWRDALREAEQREMWVGGAGELVAFWRKREQSELRIISVEVVSRNSEGEPRAVEYTVEAETGGRGLMMMVPGEFDGLTFTAATRAGQQAVVPGLVDEVLTTELPWLQGEAHLIPLLPGFTTVGIRYER
ncbi:MAG: hypothetical protein ACI81R_000539 [Bradymonadia bacterium]|jgi:hypothetical protein